MKKQLLNLLFCAGAITAQAAVGDVVTSLGDINSTTAYTLSLDGRGTMPNGNGVEQMYGTTDSDNFGKFLIIKVDELSIGNQNQYVIYSLDNKQFMTNRSTNTNVYDNTPAQALFNLSSSNVANRFLIKSSNTDKWLQFGGDKQFLLADGWKAQDAGNRWSITVAEENVDATEANTKISSYLNSYVAEASNLSNNSTYIIKNVDRAFLNTTATAANASKVNYSEIAILKGAKGYYLYDVANSKFIGTQDLTSTDSPLNHYSLTVHDGTADSKYKFKLTSSATNYLLQSDTNPTLVVTSNWTTTDNGNKWAFFPAGTFDSSAAMAKIADMEAEMSVTPINGLDELSTTKVYLLKNRGFDGYLKGNTNGGRLLYQATADISNLNDPVYRWEIVNIPDEGYAFRNVGTGTYITNLSSEASAEEWIMTNDPIFVYNVLTEFTDDENNKYYAIRNIEHSYFDGTNDYAHLHVNNSGNTVNWEETNEHTQYAISACGTVDNYEETLQTALMTAVTNKITSMTSTGLNPEGADNRIGFLTSEANANLAAAYETANSANSNEAATIHEKIETIKTLNQKIAEVQNQYVHVEEGKFYTIRGAHEDYSEKYLTESYELTENITLGSGDESVTTTHNKLIATNLGENHVPAFWSFNKVEGDANTAKYNIEAANSGNFMREVAWSKSCLLVPAGHTEVGVYNYMMEQYNRQFGGVNLRGNDITLSMSDGNGANENNIRTHNGKVNGNNWIIEPAEYVTVTFNDNGFAAVKFPFAVELNDDVTAYDLTSITSNNVAMTEAHSGNIIAAGTPVLLKGNGTVKISIIYSTEDAEVALSEDEEISANATLNGSLTPEAVENAFILNGDSLVPATDKVPANSAYYIGTTGDVTPKTLGGAITTSINEISLDKTITDGYIYDLQGRRVNRAGHGLYIINGEKVYLK